MVACEFHPQVGRYHDGELRGEQRAAFEQHLRACAQCTAELARLTAMSQALRAEPMPRASGEFLARLEALASQVEDVTVLRFVRRLTAAAAAILVGATLLWTLSSTPQSQPSVATGPAPTGDERMIIDPQKAARDATSDNPAAADAQYGPLAAEFVGGQP